MYDIAYLLVIVPSAAFLAAALRMMLLRPADNTPGPCKGGLRILAAPGADAYIRLSISTPVLVSPATFRGSDAGGFGSIFKGRVSPVR